MTMLVVAASEYLIFFYLNTGYVVVKLASKDDLNFFIMPKEAKKEKNAVRALINILVRSGFWLI